jgi:peptide/nickel transport system substrate-binding protein
MFNLGKKKSLNANLDQRLVQSLKGSRIPNFTQLKYLKKYLNIAEQRLLLASVLVLLFAGIFFSVRFYLKHLVIEPTFGGEYIEGEIGTPKYINPLYSSINDVDGDLVRLVYSSLYKHAPDGSLAYDLVESLQVSPDGKTYTFKIRPNVKWHNGALLTSNDVLFTFNAIKDPEYKSPLRSSFSGVEAEVTDDQTIVFTLKEAYSGFPELLTFGILPSDIWGRLAPNSVGLTELNLKPIGTGPFKFKSLLKYESGNLKMITLEANKDYYQGSPLVGSFKVQFFPSIEEVQAALNDGSIDGVGFYADQYAIDGDEKSFLTYNKLGTAQVKGLFLNTKSSLLGDTKVRQAIAMSINKEKILSELGDTVSPLSAPILPNNVYYSDKFRKYSFSKEEAQKTLEQAGWKLVDVTDEDMAKIPELLKADAKKKKLGESYQALGKGKWYYKDGDFLILKLTAAEISDNKKIAEMMQADMLESRIKVIVELIPANQIQSDVIKTRDYEMLLTGEVLAPDADPYLYWHSSQVGSDGLNLSNLNNKEIDKLIEDGRLTPDSNKRRSDYEKFLSTFSELSPAVYIYAGKYEYVQGHKVKNFSSSMIFEPSDRFANIKDWYINTGNHFTWSASASTTTPVGAGQ